MASSSTKSRPQSPCQVLPSSADNAHPPHPPPVAQIRESFASRLDALRTETNITVASYLKEIESASVRIRKRIKLEIQSCVQQIDECEREFAEFNEDVEDIKNHCEGWVREAQTSTSQHIKMLPELMKSVENSAEKLRSRFDA